ERRIPGRAGQIDLVPTLLDLMEVDAPEHLEGQSLAPVLRGDADLSDNHVFIEWSGSDGRGGMGDGRPNFPDEEGNRIGGARWRTVIGPDGWKLSLSPDDTCELFDLENDPTEQANLYTDPAQAERIESLTLRLRDWQAETGDTVLLTR
ncbi:MAG: hypothetical protein ACYTGH_18915, partial [Planctomycetota bacterium]